MIDPDYDKTADPQLPLPSHGLLATYKALLAEQEDRRAKRRSAAGS